MTSISTISVVIPLYNKAAHIAEAIESVLNQTVSPREIIVVDDGSTDEGSSIVKRFSGKGIRLIVKNNEGVSSARNRGLQEAVGKYVAFLDADDFWLPIHLEKLSDLVGRWPHASIVSTSHYIQRDGQLFLARSSLPSGWTGEVDDFFKTFANGLSLVNSSTACVNRQMLIERGGFPVGVTRGEDVVAWARLALGNVAAHAAIPTAVYNQQAENRSANLREQELPGAFPYLNDLMRSENLNPEAVRSVAHLFDRMALVTSAGFYLCGDKLGAKKIAKFAYRAGRLQTALEIHLVMLLPLCVLKLAKRLRHRSAK